MLHCWTLPFPFLNLVMLHSWSLPFPSHDLVVFKSRTLTGPLLNLVVFQSRTLTCPLLNLLFHCRTLACCLLNLVMLHSWALPSCLLNLVVLDSWSGLVGGLPVVVVLSWRLVVLRDVVFMAAAIVVGPRMLRLPLLDIVAVSESLWVLREVVRVFFVVEGAMLVPLKIMRLSGMLHVRQVSLVVVLAHPLLVGRLDRGPTMLTMGSLIRIFMSSLVRVITRWRKRVLDILVVTVVLVFSLIP
jgi:hypothetical protein